MSDTPNGSTATALARTNDTPPQSTDIMTSASAFEHMQRVAKMFASSTLIPAHLQGKLADVTIALVMARELRENPLIVMQSIYIISGKAGWAATYMISRANRSGRFKGGIRWREHGTGDSLVVTAYATLAETGDEISVDVSMQMARDEGWTKNAKYRSMPAQMLRYRSATMLIRLYAPEVMLGQTAEEVEDIHYAGGGDSPVSSPIPTGDLSEIIDAEDASMPEASDTPPPTQDESTAPAPEPEAAADSDFLDYSAFYAACEKVAIRDNINGFDAAMKSLPVLGYDVRSTRRQKAVEAQNRVYAAMRDGQFDWSSGKITA